MTIFLACLSAAALIVSVVAVGYSRKATAAADRSAIAAERSADAAQSSDRLSRVPQLDLTLVHPAPPPTDKAIYRVRNDGPQDLSAVTIFRPRPPDRITYPLAITGLSWADDEISFPLKIGDYKEITFCCGAADQSFWLDPDRQGTGQELRDNAERISDPQLRSTIEEIACTWDSAWALSPRRQVTVINLNAPIKPENPARLAQFHASEDAAQEGLDRCAAALVIFNSLEAGSR